ncbi:MAG: histidinol-phosphatase HisJ family protein [Lachnospiraceae bacterium]
MPVTADFHLHSSHSGDSDASMEDMILKGIDKGLTHMCFTEHMDYDFPANEDCPEDTFILNPDSYLFDLIKYKERYENKLAVRFGLELGLQPHLFGKNARLIRDYDWDFVIGSSHVVNGRDPYYPSFYEGRSEESAYREYFESVLANIKKFSNFDVYGHLDYVVRYGPNKADNYGYAKYADILDEILTTLIENEKGIELNTGAFREGLSEPNPCCDIIRRYRELGGEIITVGSDAHSPKDVAAHFDKASDILTACGFKYYTVFQYRIPEYKKL